ncbi:hypothetical protein SAMN05421823_11597 [Catalinimonas alkaloidigena]|uniref:Uncharacterized protein n=1 Tax=Catalinimonas alkaloidigena TaxID=1075417 RepID=A0A1G9U5G1_9BACT|nr:hypothetical protein [Catalinimonas alkaloidigena]SDM55220.1 hypothetical protein SAMN05421823_11597 [Catalinimonas alkaloidigena]
MKEPLHVNKKPMDAQLLVPLLDYDPHQQRIYHPAIGKGAVVGGLLGGLLMALLTWGLAAGWWPVAGLGQLAAGGEGVAAFFGFVVGSSLGGLTGALAGLRKIDIHAPKKS